MDYVLTLISAPDKAQLDVDLVRRTGAALQARSARIGAPVWLEPGFACDLPFADLSPEDARSTAASLLANRPIDCFAQIAAGRKKRLLVCDMDATIVTGETLDDLSTFAVDKDEIDRLTRMSVTGAVGFSESLIRRAELLKGLTEAEFAVTYAKIELSPGAATLIATMKKDGAMTALVSGGFRYFTSRIAARIGFDIDIANDLSFRDGRTNGLLIPPIVDPDGLHGKVGSLRRLAEERGLALAETAAIGDGANDIPMLKIAGLGCAYRGKPKVRSAIPCQLNFADLTGLLFLMGYRKTEFAAPTTGPTSSRS